MFIMESVDDLWDHIAYVMSYAPDKFPYRDFLGPSEQMNLDMAFDHLHQGVLIAYPEAEFESRRQFLFALLSRCKNSYLAGEELAAGHMLNEFQDLIFRAPQQSA